MYPSDSIYFHLGIVFQFLRLEYYSHYKLYRKSEKYFDEVNDSIGALLSSYNMHTFPSRFLFTKLERQLRNNSTENIYEENQGLFIEFEPDIQNVPQYVSYICYRTLCQLYVNKHEEAIRWLNKLLNDISLKKYPMVHLEIKIFLGFLYVIVKDNELLAQLLSSLQRQVRIISKETCMHAVLAIKMIKTAIQNNKIDKEEKLISLAEKIKKVIPTTGFSLTKYLKIDETFIKKLL
jgi:hypothetical protein